MISGRCRVVGGRLRETKGAFFFNRDHGVLNSCEGNGEPIGGVMLYMQIEEVCKMLRRGVAINHANFDIGPVTVVRRSAQ